MNDSLGVKRRLSCLLAADAVGFSAHMARDETGTARVLSAHRAIIDSITAFHDGQIVNTAGDSVLAEFKSVVEAVRCAVEIQEALKTRNESLAPEHQMLFRIGLNLGDVLVSEHDILGDGVNVAARLESIAEPGGICISSSVYDQITGKLDLGFTDMGNQSLKNIGRPIHAYRVSGARRAAEPSLISVAAPKRRPRPTMVLVAVATVAAAGITALAAWQWRPVAVAPLSPAPTTLTSTTAPAPGTAAMPMAPSRDAAPADTAPVHLDDAAPKLSSSSSAVAQRPARRVGSAGAAGEQSAATMSSESRGPDVVEIARQRARVMASRGAETDDAITRPVMPPSRAFKSLPSGEVVGAGPHRQSWDGSVRTFDVQVPQGGSYSKGTGH